MKTETFLGVILAAGLIVGCDKDEPRQPVPQAEEAPAAPAPQGKSLTGQLGDVVGQGKQAVSNVASDATQAGKSAYEQAKPKVQEATTQLKQEAADAATKVKTGASQLLNASNEKGSQLTAGTQQAAADSTTSTATTTPDGFNYQQKIQEVTTYLKENKLDLAEKSLVQIESRKASIPQTYHAKIDGLRKMVDAAKAKQGGGSLLGF